VPVLTGAIGALNVGEPIEALKPYQIASRGVGRTFQMIRVFPELTDEWVIEVDFGR
jgi:ABC-type branched-subunit amino acid transport system ATPase component